jgi:hypothetical protein
VADRLHRPAFNVTFEVKNTGNVYGGEVSPVHIGLAL